MLTAKEYVDNNGVTPGLFLFLEDKNTSKRVRIVIGDILSTNNSFEWADFVGHFGDWSVVSSYNKEYLEILNYNHNVTFNTLCKDTALKSGTAFTMQNPCSDDLKMFWIGNVCPPNVQAKTAISCKDQYKDWSLRSLQYTALSEDMYPILN